MGRELYIDKKGKLSQKTQNIKKAKENCKKGRRKRHQQKKQEIKMGRKLNIDARKAK